MVDQGEEAVGQTASDSWLDVVTKLSADEAATLTRVHEVVEFWDLPASPTRLDLFVETLITSPKHPQFPSKAELAAKGINCPYASARWALFVAVLVANRDVSRPRKAKMGAIKNLRDLAAGVLTDTNNLAMKLEHFDFHREPVGANEDFVRLAQEDAARVLALKGLNDGALTFFKSLDRILSHLDGLEADLEGLPSKPKDIWRQAFAFEMRRWWISVFDDPVPTTGGNSVQKEHVANRANRFTQMLMAAFGTLGLGVDEVWADMGRNAATYDDHLKDTPWLSAMAPATGIAPTPIPTLDIADLLYRLALAGNPDPLLAERLGRLMHAGGDDHRPFAPTLEFLQLMQKATRLLSYQSGSRQTN